MQDVKIPLTLCLRMLEMPRTNMIKILVERITISLGLSEDMEDEDQDDSETHLESPEAE